ncbi:hypothetical protein NQ317_004766 [Molorchus minor]|uniref:Uncharacterized protein n=1 Tax=Molorchus minor TaxID=1323400 RepID=A0ABQ9JJS8_9CUCU|nr:hypothetical protein NQ317_004766 [Molorchus minor]
MVVNKPITFSHCSAAEIKFIISVIIPLLVLCVADMAWVTFNSVRSLMNGDLQHYNVLPMRANALAAKTHWPRSCASTVRRDSKRHGEMTERLLDPVNTKVRRLSINIPLPVHVCIH